MAVAAYGRRATLRPDVERGPPRFPAFGVGFPAGLRP